MFDEDQVFYRYKYLPFSEGSLKTLTEGTIKFTHPAEFNDPFDSKPNFIAISANQINERRPGMLKAVADGRGLSPAKRLQAKGEMAANLRNGLLNGSYANDIMKNVGVVSLSKRATNILMWSHYAQSHKGFVLEFRIPYIGDVMDEIHSIDRLLPYPVIYHLDRPQIEIPEKKGVDTLDRLLLMKSEIWKYEEEERVIDAERGPGIYSYRRDEVLCSVIAGLKMSNSDYQNLEAIVQNLAGTSIPSLRLFKASDKGNAYELEVKDHPRLDATRL